MAKAKARKPKAAKYWWFRGEEVTKLQTLLAGVGASGRVEIHPAGNAVTVRVVAEGAGPTEAGGVTGPSFTSPQKKPV